MYFSPPVSITNVIFHSIFISSLPASLNTLSAFLDMSCLMQLLKKDTTAAKAMRCVSRESNAGPIDGNDGFYH